MARQKLVPGDYYEIPLEAGYSALGQMLSVEKEALNAVACAFWATIEEDPISQLGKSPISVLLITPDLIKSGVWKALGNASISVPENMRTYEQFRANRWIGAKVIGSGIVRKFLNAFNGLQYWDSWANPKYLESLLAPGIPVPREAVFKQAPNHSMQPTVPLRGPAPDFEGYA